MKKTYITPQIAEVNYTVSRIIAGSGVNGTVGTESIGYGGVDTDGSLEPEVKQDGGWFDN